jgi:hypothetical protein
VWDSLKRLLANENRKTDQGISAVTGAARERLICLDRRSIAFFGFL